MAKTIFNSSEKSNFILNMTEEQYSSLASKGLLAGLFGVPLFTLIPEISGNTGFYSLTASGLAIAGVICMIFALIGAMKKFINKTAVFPICIFGFIFLWGLISALASDYMQIGIYGYDGRNEGLMSLMFYLCIFVTASSLKRRKAVETVMNGIVGLGLLNSLWSLYQIASSNGHYTMVSLRNKINAASGLSHSPIFLAMILTLCLIAAVVSYAVTDSKKKRVFLLVCSCLFSFVMMFTYCFIGIVGAALGVIAVFAAVIKAKAPKIRLLSVFSVILPAVLAVLLVNGGIVGDSGKYTLYDGQIFLWADSYMRISASGQPSSETLELGTYDTYATLNSKAMNIVSLHPVTGTGPDQLALSQLYNFDNFPEGTEYEVTDIVSQNKGVFDRVLNEYIYTAATRGIPSAVALVLLLIAVIVSAVKNLKESKDKTKGVMTACTICGALILLIGCGSTTFTPLFWTIAGCSIASCKEKTE